MRKTRLRKHHITSGLGPELEIYYQNGPEMVANGNIEEIAAYSSGGLAYWYVLLARARLFASARIPSEGQRREQSQVGKRLSF